MDVLSGWRGYTPRDGIFILLIANSGKSSHISSSRWSEYIFLPTANEESSTLEFVGMLISESNYPTDTSLLALYG